MKTTEKKLYILVALLAGLIFCGIYGVRVLDPTYTSWLMQGGDLTQHYLGWRAFRAGSWHFPIGMIDNLAYPYQVSIIYTDSIPCFAILFKLLSPVLPENFQYFGLWGILCFMLSGVMAARILRRYSDSALTVIFASLLFAFAPIVIWRMYDHTALAAQWILLYGMEPLFHYGKYGYGTGKAAGRPEQDAEAEGRKPAATRRIFTAAVIMAGLSASTHMYFVLMSGILLAGFCLMDVLKHRRVAACWGRAAAVLAVYCAVAAGIIALLGGFAGGIEASYECLGQFSFNLTEFFNPYGYSCLLQTQAVQNIGQYEGFSYLGLGIIVMLIYALVEGFGSGSIPGMIRSDRPRTISLAAVCLVSVAIAASPIVTWGTHVLWQLRLPALVQKAWAVFRASGRIVWIALYILMFVICIIAFRTLNRRTAAILMALALVLQVYDLHVTFTEKYCTFGLAQEYPSFMTDTDFWGSLGEDSSLRHVVYVSDFDDETMYDVTAWALDHGKTTNDFYFARPVTRVAEGLAQTMAELPDDTVYLMTEADCEAYGSSYDLTWYHVDGIAVGLRE